MRTDPARSRVQALSARLILRGSPQGRLGARLFPSLSPPFPSFVQLQICGAKARNSFVDVLHVLTHQYVPGHAVNVSTHLCIAQAPCSMWASMCACMCACMCPCVHACTGMSSAVPASTHTHAHTHAHTHTQYAPILPVPLHTHPSG